MINISFGTFNICFHIPDCHFKSFNPNQFHSQWDVDCQSLIDVNYLVSTSRSKINKKVSSMVARFARFEGVPFRMFRHWLHVLF